MSKDPITPERGFPGMLDLVPLKFYTPLKVCCIYPRKTVSKGYFTIVIGMLNFKSEKVMVMQ